MEDKLITLAIHTFEKAQILKTILESENIEVYIHNVNLIQPVISSGVRVRIKETDLPVALRVIEETNWLSESDNIDEVPNKDLCILIPIDFSEYSIKACEMGFKYASLLGADVVLLNVYFTPFFPSAIPIGDTSSYQFDNSQESMEILLAHVEKEMNDFTITIDNQINSGELPAIAYSYKIREGLPEEEIHAYAKELQPLLIIMGTRGKGNKEHDVIGSVSSEVIENSKYPVLTISEKIRNTNLLSTKNIAFATSFDQRDIRIFEKFVKLIKLISPLNLHIHLFNVSTSENEWNEIRLSGLNDYFLKQYPLMNITHTVLDDGDILLSIDKFVKNNNIEIITVGNHKRSFLMKLIRSSLAQKMLFHSEIPLLVIPS